VKRCGGTRSFAMAAIGTVDARAECEEHVTARDAAIVSTDCAAARGLPSYDPERTDVVVYHAKCTDGFAAAVAAHRRLGDRAAYVAADHGPDAPTGLDVRGKHVVVVDYCFKRDVTARMAAEAASFVVLDHHVSAQAEIADLDPAKKVFQMAQSGATLAWNYFHPGTPVPLLLRYVEDKDIWRWALRDSRAFSAGFMADDTFAAWGAMLDGGAAAIDATIAKGRAILEYQDGVVKRHVESAVPCVLAAAPHFAGRLVNATTMASNIGNVLASQPGVDYALMWFYNHENDTYVCSLRSARDDVDVAAIARSLGGGGHKRASGFSYAGPRLQDLFTSIGAAPAGGVDAGAGGVGGKA